MSVIFNPHTLILSWYINFDMSYAQVLQCHHRSKTFYNESVNLTHITLHGYNMAPKTLNSNIIAII